MNPHPHLQDIDLDASIQKLKKINLRLSRVLRRLTEERREEKKKQNT